MGGVVHHVGVEQQAVVDAQRRWSRSGLEGRDLCAACLAGAHGTYLLLLATELPSLSPSVVYHHEPRHVAQLRRRRPRGDPVPGAPAGGLHPGVPAERRDQDRVRPGRLPDGEVHQPVRGGVREPEFDDVEGRLWPAVAEELVLGPVLALGPPNWLVFA